MTSLPQDPSAANKRDGLVICNVCRLGRWRAESIGETDKRPVERITIMMDAFREAVSLVTIVGQMHASCLVGRW